VVEPGKALDGRRRVERELRALEPQHPRGLGEVAVVADEHANLADARVEHRISEIAGLEEVLLPEDRPDLRDVRLVVLAQHRSIRVDDERGVVEDALELLLEERHDEHHLVPARELSHRLHGRSVVGLRRLEPLRLLLRAVVGTEEDLL
jgi:hypothetical protein